MSMQITPSFGNGIAAVASLPRKDVLFIPSPRAQRGDPEDWRTHDYYTSSHKSFHSGFTDSISSIFFALLPALIVFSAANASFMDEKTS